MTAISPRYNIVVDESLFVIFSLFFCSTCLSHNSLRIACSFFAHQTDGEGGDDNAPDGDAGGVFVDATGSDGRATLSHTNPNPNDVGGTFFDRATARRVHGDPEPNRPHGSTFIGTGPDGNAMQVDNNPNNVSDEAAVDGLTVSLFLVRSVTGSILYVLNSTQLDIFSGLLILLFFFFLQSTNIEDYQIGGRFHESLVGRRVRTKNHGTGTIVTISATGKTVKIHFDGDDAPHSTWFKASSIEEVLPRKSESMPIRMN